MRAVMEALESSGLAWYITGSVALAAYGPPRQTMDVDVVIDATTGDMGKIARLLSDVAFYSEPLRFGSRMLAALIDRKGAGKVDLIVRDSDAWGRAALDRRCRWDDPALGTVWISSLEDLILAKLEWSEGTSESQLRDCRSLLRMSAGRLDDEYLDSWAAELGVGKLLVRARAETDAS